MTSSEEKSKLIFGGEKSEYKPWREDIVLKFLEKGVDAKVNSSLEVKNLSINLGERTLS